MGIRTNLKKRKCVYAITSTLACLPACVVYAQESNLSGGKSTIDEIIVTAQRRSESLQDVPISITAISPQDLTLAGVTSSRELMMVVPGLRVETTGAYVQPSIRGISTSVVSPTAEANIATYIDGVYQTTQVAAIYELPDVQQIEVLKGPQGTLFGRNATGGAILINTLVPDAQESNGLISASYGRYNQSTLKGYLSIPIVKDKMALSISGLYDEMDGFRRHLLQNGNKVGDAETKLLRGKLRFLPWEGADFTLTGLYADREDFSAVKNTNYKGNNVASQTLPSSQVASKPWEFSGNEDPYAFSEQRSISLRGNIEIGAGVLTTTTAYVKDENTLTSDSDNSPLPTTYIFTPGFAKSFQQELVYATDQIGSIQAVGGLFYYQNEGGQDLSVNRNQLTIYQRDEVESYAAFGELTFDVTERFSVITGVRYSHDSHQANATIAFGSVPEPASIPEIGNESWNAWTPRVSLLYDLTDNTNVYFTYNEGFKSGLFNTVSFQTTPVNPEEVKAYEIGLKTRELDNISMSIAAFYYDYTDLQQPTAVLNAGVPRQELRNAASSEIYGVELSGAWNPSASFNLTGGITYLNAEYESYPAAVVNLPTGLGGNEQVVADVSGNTLIRSPEWSSNLTATYEIETGMGIFDISGTLFYSSKFYLESYNRVEQPDYTLLNSSMGFNPSANGFEFRLWGKNLTNEAVIYGSNVSVGGDSIIHAQPRTYGVDATYRF